MIMCDSKSEKIEISPVHGVQTAECIDHFKSTGNIIGESFDTKGRKAERKTQQSPHAHLDALFMKPKAPIESQAGDRLVNLIDLVGEQQPLKQFYVDKCWHEWPKLMKINFIFLHLREIRQISTHTKLMNEKQLGSNNSATLLAAVGCQSTIWFCLFMSVISQHKNSTKFKSFFVKNIKIQQPMLSNHYKYHRNK